MQGVLCGFSFALLCACLGRLVFLFRLFGTVIPSKVSIGFEAACLFFVLLGVVFTKSAVAWGNVVGMLVFGAMICLLYFIDDRFYLYVVTDDIEEE
jgi:hypothetical protein